MNPTELISICGLGLALGLKHSLDGDHLAAVSTIVSERKGVWDASLVGVVWGIGHTASLMAVGVLVVVFGLRIPEWFAVTLEFLVALMLIGLGVRVLWRLRHGGTLHVHVHEHGGRLHLHPHVHQQSTEAHSHEDGRSSHHAVQVGRKPLLVGLVHGLAGSAALMLIVSATIPSQAVALLYIGIFGIGSIGGMFAVSLLIGIPFALAARRRRIARVIETTAALVSICFGCLLAYEIGIVRGIVFFF